MAARFRLACVQTNACNDMQANLGAAERWVREAADAGADLIALPECAAMMEPDRSLVPVKAGPPDDHPALRRFEALARETGAWILVGSVAVRLEDGRVANRSVLIDAAGGRVAEYDKIHMFDVDLDGGESYRESQTYRPGEAACVAPTPWGFLGVTVCYDLRFPGLYRDLAHAGAVMLSVPSAFTRPTGEAHWHVLLRARAIETGCYVFAPAQCGVHPGDRKTYGHSLIVDPWGEVLADGGEETGVVMADIDMARVEAVRRSLPSLTHDRAYRPPAAPRMATPKAASSGR